MTFGDALRRARESRGWSRFRLTLAVKERFRAEGSTVDEGTIKLLETGKTVEPRGTTRSLLTAVLPELPRLTTSMEAT